MALGTAALLAVLFAGAWATQPTITADDSGFSLAFGPQPEAVAPAPVIGAPDLVEAALEARVQAAVAAERERMREALQQTVAAMVDQRARATEVKFSSELAGTREDLESSLYITNSKYEQLIKELSEAELAVAR